MSQNSPRVVVIEENALRAAILVDGLREAGMSSIDVLSSTDGLLRRLAALDPEVIIIGLVLVGALGATAGWFKLGPWLVP